MSLNLLFANIVILSTLLSIGSVLFVRIALTKRAVMDRPNERSMHKRPVPRGGGLAIAPIILFGMVLFWGLGKSLSPQIWLLPASLLLILVSWLDDRKGASVFLRLGTHLLAAILGSFAFTSDQTILNGLLPLWADRILMILCWAWFINLTNFMDGIDGLTGTEIIFIAVGVMLAFNIGGINDPSILMLAALITGSCLGFLTFNWHPATIFLGDVGSVPLGFLSGYLLLSLATHGYLAAALILPLYYLADSGITILKRLLRKEKIWQAHREHFYQRAAQACDRHDKIVFLIIYANIALVVAALTSMFALWPGIIFSIVALALLLRTMHKIAQS